MTTLLKKSTNKFDISIISLTLGLFIQLCLITSCSKQETQTLVCRQQNRSVLIDGRESGLEWYGVDSVQLVATDGKNFQDQKTVVTIKAQRVGRVINFLFKWSDLTRSYNKMLEKREDGWYKFESELSDGESENRYWEDQLAVSFWKEPKSCLKSCHDIESGKVDSSIVEADIWFWQSVSSNPAVQANDLWYNSFDRTICFENKAGGGAQSNLNLDWMEPYFLPSGPYSRYWINLKTEHAQFYRPDLDHYKIGGIVPGVVVAPMMGDIADVTAFGMWRGREWVVEMSRQLSTGSQFDFLLRDTLYLNVAVFDNSQKEHALSSRPIRLVIE